MPDQPQPATHIAVPLRLAQRIAQHLQAIPGQPFLDELHNQRLCPPINLSEQPALPPVVPEVGDAKPNGKVVDSPD